MNPMHDVTILGLYQTDPSISQYLLYNCFRILRPLRWKYKLTINELIILNGMYIYNKLVSSDFSRNNIKTFVGYFNSNKIKYYVGSLIDKDCIYRSGVLNGYDRFKITPKGIEVVSDIDNCYDLALKKFLLDNNIEL